MLERSLALGIVAVFGIGSVQARLTTQEPPTLFDVLNPIITRDYTAHDVKRIIDLYRLMEILDGPIVIPEDYILFLEKRRGVKELMKGHHD